MDKAQAQKASKNGATAAFVSAGFSFVFVVLAMATSASGELGTIFNDPWNFLDIAIIVGCGIGLLRYSRTASIFLFSYFIISKVVMYVELGRITGILGLVFLYFFGRAIQGTFVYHSIRQGEDPDYRSSSRKWSLIIGVPLGVISVIFVVILSYGFMMEWGIVPDAVVVEGGDLRPGVIDVLTRKQIIRPDENIIMFYSASMFSFLGDGNIVTNKRVISYEKIDGKLVVYRADLEDITEVYIEEKGESLNDSFIYVKSSDRHDDSFYLIAPIDDMGDVRFLSEIMKRAGLPADDSAE